MGEWGILYSHPFPLSPILPFPNASGIATRNSGQCRDAKVSNAFREINSSFPLLLPPLPLSPTLPFIVMNPDAPVIGILSGMGPYAGLDLAAKIHALTRAQTDQEHLPVALLSYPGWIPDRSAFLADPEAPSPVPPLAAITRRLHRAGATVLGMPCNTAHAPAILNAVQEALRRSDTPVRFIHMIEETARHVREALPEVRRVGVLATPAVCRLGLYRQALAEAGLEALHPASAVQRAYVTPAIFDESYGIKAQSDPVTPRARRGLREAVRHLRERGAEAVILGCTEFPPALPEPVIDGLPLLDPTAVLARALIRTTYPERLRRE